MKKIFFSLIVASMVILPQQVVAQGLKTSGSSAVDIVPAGWESIFKTGDLNKDGIADLVIIATPCKEENMTTRDDGYVYNFNQPILAIYWGEKNGNFKLFKQYDNVIPVRPDEFMSIDPSLEIAKNGSLRIILEYFASAGSWTQPTSTHVFSYRNGDFFLIGKDVVELERTTGKTVSTSENYLTHKRIVTTDRPNRKPTVKNTRLPKSALKPLGFNLDESDE
ncbi:MAG: FG-GAP repeat protein [Muribaculaceae bacterium]|nr:FG-GAP repeat protein [Muribaculaceae bacterium]